MPTYRTLEPVLGLRSTQLMIAMRCHATVCPSLRRSLLSSCGDASGRTAEDVWGVGRIRSLDCTKVKPKAAAWLWDVVGLWVSCKAGKGESLRAPSKRCHLTSIKAWNIWNIHEPTRPTTTLLTLFAPLPCLSNASTCGQGSNRFGRTGISLGSSWRKFQGWPTHSMLRTEVIGMRVSMAIDINLLAMASNPESRWPPTYY